jgi:hypothetical protein
MWGRGPTRPTQTKFFKRKKICIMLSAVLNYALVHLFYVQCTVNIGHLPYRKQERNHRIYTVISYLGRDLS